MLELSSPAPNLYLVSIKRGRVVNDSHGIQAKMFSEFGSLLVDQSKGLLNHESLVKLFNEYDQQDSTYANIVVPDTNFFVSIKKMVCPYPVAVDQCFIYCPDSYTFANGDKVTASNLPSFLDNLVHKSVYFFTNSLNVGYELYQLDALSLGLETVIANELELLNLLEDANVLMSEIQPRNMACELCHVTNKYRSAVGFTGRFDGIILSKSGNWFTVYYKPDRMKEPEITQVFELDVIRR